MFSIPHTDVSSFHTNERESGRDCCAAESHSSHNHVITLDVSEPYLSKIVKVCLHNI